MRGQPAGTSSTHDATSAGRVMYVDLCSTTRVIRICRNGFVCKDTISPVVSHFISTGVHQVDQSFMVFCLVMYIHIFHEKTSTDKQVLGWF